MHLVLWSILQMGKWRLSKTIHQGLSLQTKLDGWLCNRRREESCTFGLHPRPRFLTPTGVETGTQCPVGGREGRS